MGDIVICQCAKLPKLIASTECLQTKENRLAVYSKLSLLCLTLYQRFSNELTCLPSSTTRLLYPLQKHAPPNANLLNNINKNIRNNKMMGKFPFTTAITTQYDDINNKAKYENWQGLILLCSLQLFIIGKHDCAINSALRQIRLIATTSRHAKLLDILPDINEFTSLGLLLEDLNKLRLELKDNSHQHHQYFKRFNYLFIAVRNAVLQSEGIIRHRTPNPKQKPPIINVNNEDNLAIDSFDEQFDNQLSELKTQTTANKTAQEQDESLQIEKFKTLRGRINSQQNHSLETRARQHLHQANAISNKQRSTPCDINQLTQFDVQQLVIYCLDNMDDPVCAWLFMSLLTGRTPEYLFNKNQEKSIFHLENNTLYYHFQHQVPASQQSRELKKIIKETTPNIYIPLPFELQKWVQQGNFSLPEQVDFNNKLEHINNTYRTRLTVSRIAGFLEHHLKNEGDNEIIIGLLRNETHKRKPALSYGSIQIEKPYTVHHNYTKCLFELADKKLPQPQLITEKENTGSSLYLAKNVIHHLFNFLKSNVEASSDWVDYHNNFVLYTWALLTFSTGHRDVNAPFGKLSDYNKFFKTWWISDKESRHTLGARTIFLPPTAQVQIKYYLSHLNSLEKRISFTEPEIKQRCQTAIAGQRNLLFFISKKHGKLITEDLTPSLLDKKFDNLYPFQHNWPRHHFCSLFIEQEFPTDLISAWMGHQEMGEEAFGKFSNLSISDLNSINSLIENEIKIHQIKAIQGWKTR